MKSTPSVRYNTIANIVGLVFATAIGIIVYPLYLGYLGAESFGLVGFFTVLQAWMLLLDLGMSPLLSRQTAHVRGLDSGFLELKKLLRSLEIVIFGLSLIVSLVIFASSEWVAESWLNISILESSQAAVCISLMGVIIGLRFFTTLYRSGVQGMEKQVQLNLANVVFVALKFIGALLLLHFVTQQIVHFFIYQLIIGLIELLVLSIMFYSYMPATDKVGLGFFWEVLKPVLPFAGGVAYTAAIWVFLTQLDKIILSTVLPLSEYGYFALVAVIAAGILQISGAISKAILPRMTHLLSQDGETAMLSLYRASTQFMAVIMFSLTGMIALFSTELMFAWTGERNAANWAGPILFWFSLGNGILAISAFQYYLQFAHGKLRMHVIYNSVSACIQVPIIVYVAFEYGALGVALVWFTLSLINFIIWTPVVHRKFAPGIHWSWLSNDVLPVFLSTVLMLVIIHSMEIDFDGMSRLYIFITLISLGTFVLGVNIFVSSACRRMLLSAIKGKLNAG